MDLSFTLQALCTEYIVKEHKKLENRVYDVPKEIDEKVARIKLKLMGIKIDKLSENQLEYMKKWESGT